MKAKSDDRTVRGLGLDPTLIEIERWIDAVGAVARRHLELTATTDVSPSALVEVTRPPAIGELPIDGGIDAALKVVVAAAEASLNTTSPGYFGFIPGGGLYATAIADFIADILNRYTGISALSPALARLETDVLSWLAREFGYGPSARGLLTSGGSLATFVAVVRARAARRSSSSDLRLATGYVSAEGHGSVISAFQLAGISAGNLHRIPVDTTLRLRVDQLEVAIEKDRRAGLEPFIVIATAGSTNTGAIDPLPEISALCERHDLWLHADAAYGGAFILCDNGRRRLSGIERADSITFDPHKGLFLPYGTGCLLLRDGLNMHPVQQGQDSYLRDVFSEPDNEMMMDPSAFGLELSRPYRGLRLWLPLMLHGAAAFRAALDEKLELAGTLWNGLMEMAEEGLPIDLAVAPQLSIVAFRARRHDNDSLADWNQRSLALLRRINGRQRSYLSSTMLSADEGPVVTLRACVLSHRTHPEHVSHCLEDIRAAVSEL